MYHQNQNDQYNYPQPQQILYPTQPSESSQMIAFLQAQNMELMQQLKIMQQQIVSMKETRSSRSSPSSPKKKKKRSRSRSRSHHRHRHRSRYRTTVYIQHLFDHRDWSTRTRKEQHVRIQNYFRNFGDLEKVYLMTDSHGVCVGYGFVQFRTESQANRVLEQSREIKRFTGLMVSPVDERKIPSGLKDYLF